MRPTPASKIDRVLLDTEAWDDAILSGRDGPESAEDGMGLKITYSGTGTVPSVTLNGPDGEIELVGEAEIGLAARALASADWLARNFGPPMSLEDWRKQQEAR